ncbi:MAG: MTH1187 family thiamine-binding protein [Bifidobacteriaceae bacterium]|nr:MTH1187 family thiamine-binding protein [Bifidobacteriaceae bacterium]
MSSENADTTDAAQESQPAAKRTLKPATDPTYVNTLASVAIYPNGVGEELSQYVSQAVEVIRESGLTNETHSMATEIEGDLDDVLGVIRDATMKLAGQGYRTGVHLSLDIRPKFRDQMHAKVKLVDSILAAQGDADEGENAH